MSWFLDWSFNAFLLSFHLGKLLLGENGLFFFLLFLIVIDIVNVSQQISKGIFLVSDLCRIKIINIGYYSTKSTFMTACEEFVFSRGNWDPRFSLLLEVYGLHWGAVLCRELWILFSINSKIDIFHIKSGRWLIWAFRILNWKSWSKLLRSHGLNTSKTCASLHLTLGESLLEIFSLF